MLGRVTRLLCVTPSLCSLSDGTALSRASTGPTIQTWPFLGLLGYGTVPKAGALGQGEVGLRAKVRCTLSLVG